MDLKPKPAYEDFEVHTEWVHEAADDTLIAYLPGFSKDQLKVQVTSRGNLRISGERPIGVNNKFSRFTKEVPIPSNCGQNKIRANYKGGMLHVKFPKLIVPADEKPEKEKPSSEKPIPKSDQRTADVRGKQKDGVEQAIQKGPPKGKQVDKVPEQTPGKQKETEDNSKSNASNESDPRLMEKDKNGSDQEEKRSSRSEKPADSAQYAARKDDMYWLLGIHYERVIGGLAKGIKNPRKVMNMVLAVLLVVVLAVYVKCAIVSMKNY